MGKYVSAPHLPPDSSCFHSGRVWPWEEVRPPSCVAARNALASPQFWPGRHPARKPQVSPSLLVYTAQKEAQAPPASPCSAPTSPVTTHWEQDHLTLCFCICLICSVLWDQKPWHWPICETRRNRVTSAE